MNPLAESVLPGNAGYAPGSGFDEAVGRSGEVRSHYAALLDSLSGLDLGELEGASRRAAARLGMTFGPRHREAPFRIDPVPRLITRREWQRVAHGLEQRVRALNEFLLDMRSDRRVITAGRIPERVIESAELAEPEASTLPVDGGTLIGVSGLDLVRDAGGRWLVLEDNLRSPSGIEYAIGARRVVEEALPFELPVRQTSPSARELLQETLRAAAPARCGGDPAVVLLCDGPDDGAHWEHRVLSAALGIPMVTPSELESRGGRLVARPAGRREPIAVDVVYRRTGEVRLHDEAGRPTWLAQALLEPCRRGMLSCVNGFGTGLADDKLVHAYVEEMIRFYLGQDPILPSVPTYDLGEPEVRGAALDRIGELVVKPRSGLGGAGIVVCPHAAPEDRRRVADEIRRRPQDYVAQEMVELSTHPTVVGGRLEPRHVDLRPYVYWTPSGPRAATEALTRVAFGAGALVVNSSQNGGGKDTVVLG